MAKRVKIDNESLDLRLQSLAWLMTQKGITRRQLGRDLPSYQETTPQSWFNKKEWPEWAEGEICAYFRIGRQFFNLVQEGMSFEEAREKAGLFLSEDERERAIETLEAAIRDSRSVEEKQKEALAQTIQARIQLERLRDDLKEW